MRSVILFLMVVLAGLQYKLWLGDGSISRWQQVETKLAEQKQKNREARARNLALEADIAELKSGDQALEEQARYELGMVKEGEVYYQCVE